MSEVKNTVFTEGIKPGGLTTNKEIRILLCYLVLHAPAPLTGDEIEHALLHEELVNYFALHDNLSELLQNGLLQLTDGRYSATATGKEIADTLERDVPTSVRESALRAVIAVQAYTKKEAEHKTEITPCENGFLLTGSIADFGGEIFRTSLYMPTRAVAEEARRCFIESGDEVYKLVLASLTGNKEMLRDILQSLPPKKETNE